MRSPLPTPPKGYFTQRDTGSRYRQSNGATSATQAAFDAGGKPTKALKGPTHITSNAPRTGLPVA